MKKQILVWLIILPLIESSAIGLGDWQRDTPYGNYMYDAGGGTSLVFRTPYQELTGVNQWYFYSGHTIGQYSKGYFIADEKRAELKLFKDQQNWETSLVKLKLKPFWTRWYTDDWHLLDDLLLVMVFAFYVSVPILIVLGIILYYAFIRERFNPSKPYTLIILGLTILIAVQYYLEINPASV
jgi:hypothetical protein